MPEPPMPISGWMAAMGWFSPASSKARHQAYVWRYVVSTSVPSRSKKTAGAGIGWLTAPAGA